MSLVTARRQYVTVAGVLLLATGIVKLISQSVDKPFLAQRDPLLTMLTNRQVLMLAGVLECVVALVLLQSRERLNRLWIILWIGSLFSLYRLGLWLIRYTGPCPCLGRSFDWLTSRQSFVDAVLAGLLAYLLGGSAILLLLDFASNTRTAPTAVTQRCSSVINNNM